MNIRLIVRTVSLAAVAALIAGAATLARRTPARADSGDVARGQYLVMDAGKCSDCHGEKLTGGPNFVPAPPNTPWATSIPRIAGLPMFASDADAVKFLTTGLLPDGNRALGPMPQYRFNQADATAIVAYLRSLKT